MKPLKPSTIASKNEQGTMVSETPVTQKRTPHGVTSMKNVIRARSKNIKLTVEWNTRGQPCNNKGGNTLLEESETHFASSAIDLDVLWVDARTNKQGVINNEQVQEVVVIEKALGLRQYPGLIRGARFGVRKRTIKHQEKRATKVEVAYLQDKFDNHSQQFLEMQRLMNSKFTEGPQASTVNEMAIGTVYNTLDAMLHNAQIPSNHVRVSIDISIEYDALMRSPLDEDAIIIGGAIGTYVAWPGKVIADHSATSNPRVEHASKKAKVVKSKSKPRPKSNVESYLYDNLISKTQKKLMFLSPHSTTLIPSQNNEKETSYKTAHIQECVVEFLRVSNCKSTKERWDTLETTHEGTEEAKRSRLNTLSEEYEMFRMKPREIILDLQKIFTHLTNHLIALGKMLSNIDLNLKVLRSLTRSWQRKEHELDQHEEQEKKKKNISLKAKIEKYESSEDEDENEETDDMSLFMKKFSKNRSNEKFH
ncbi:hypothetical protein Lal_00008513 [Lupinus albus]|nr:hypothetical protein Lal_00008513 [Lupinus albus]